MDGKSKTKLLTFASVMAVLSNILSVELATIPLVIGRFSKFHFAQIPTFVSGVLTGPWASMLMALLADCT
jgi:riboflavin transporter FmnP